MGSTGVQSACMAIGAVLAGPVIRVQPQFYDIPFNSTIALSLWLTVWSQWQASRGAWRPAGGVQPDPLMALFLGYIAAAAVALLAQGICLLAAAANTGGEAQ